MNWNPTENCFFYHLSFILHGSLCALLLRYLFLVLLCPPLSPTSSFSLCLRVAAIPHRSSRCATANSHLPKRSCRVQVDGNVVSGNQIQVLREKAKQRETEREREWNDKREVRMLLFSITLFGAFWTKKEKEIRSRSTWFFWFASTVGFSLRKICFLYCRIIREFRLIS